MELSETFKRFTVIAVQNMYKKESAEFCVDRICSLFLTIQYTLCNTQRSGISILNTYHMGRIC